METRPPQWKEILDAQTNKFYYWDPLTNAIRWSIPDSLWRKFRDPKTAKSFYCHVETQQVTWTLPSGLICPEPLEMGTGPRKSNEDKPEPPPPPQSLSRPASPPTSRLPSPIRYSSPAIPTLITNGTLTTTPSSGGGSSSSRPSSPTFRTPLSSLPETSSLSEIKESPSTLALTASIPPSFDSPLPMLSSPTKIETTTTTSSSSSPLSTTELSTPPRLRATSHDSPLLPITPRYTGSSPRPMITVPEFKTKEIEPCDQELPSNGTGTTPDTDHTNGMDSMTTATAPVLTIRDEDASIGKPLPALTTTTTTTRPTSTSPRLSKGKLHRRVLSGGSAEEQTRTSKKEMFGNISGSGSKSPVGKGHGRMLSWATLKSPKKVGLTTGGLLKKAVSESLLDGGEAIPPPPPLYLALPHVAPRLSELPETPLEKIGTPRHPMPTDLEVRKKAPWVRAIQDYHPMGEEEHLHLTFDQDDVILILSKPSSEWWTGQVVGLGEDAPSGKFPSQYVVQVDTKVILPESTTVVAEESSPLTSQTSFSLNNKIREIVSKKKRRFKQDGFNLDLSYITNNIIAMGYPSKKIEGVYRNHMKDVQRFFNENHPKAFKIYNLCSEREYNANKFEKHGGKVARYPFDDHNPCPFEVIETFCEDVRSFLSQDRNHVVAIHCKAGKGRTGFMVACYLLYSGVFTDPDSALRYFAVKRTHNEKGVTIPSQRRYTWYFHELLRRRRSLLPALPSINPLYLESIRIRGIPYALRSNTSPDLYFEIDGGENKFSSLNLIKPAVLGDTITFGLKQINYIKLDWDIKVNVFSKKLQIAGGGGFGYERLFHFWINLTFCETDVRSIEMGTLKPPTSPHRRRVLLIKSQIDKAVKDKTNKLFPPGMCIELLFTKEIDPTLASFGASSSSSLASSSSSSSLQSSSSFKSTSSSGSTPT